MNIESFNIGQFFPSLLNLAFKGIGFLIQKIRILINPYAKLLGGGLLEEPMRIYYGKLKVDYLLGDNTINITRETKYDIDNFATAVFNGIIPPFGDINTPPSGIPLPHSTMPLQLEKIRIYTSYQTESGTRIVGPDRLVGENEAQVIGYLFAIIMKAGIKKPPVLFPAGRSLPDNSNFTFSTIGGPGSNAVTNQVMFSQLSVNFNNERDHIKLPGNKQYTIEGRNDIAILAKTDNPIASDSDKKYKCFILAGLGENGTQGAGRFLYTHAKELVSTYGSNNFEVVLKVNADNLSKTNIIYENGRKTLRWKLKYFMTKKMKRIKRIWKRIA